MRSEVGPESVKGVGMVPAPVGAPVGVALLVRIAAAGHDPWFDEPVHVVAEIERFVATAD